MYASVKMAELSDIVGAFHQDRYPGVMGVMANARRCFQ